MHTHNKPPDGLKIYQEKIKKYFTEEYHKDLQWSRKIGVKDGFLKGIIVGLITGVAITIYIIDAYCALGTKCEPLFYISAFNLIILVIINPLLISSWIVLTPQELQGPKTIKQSLLITFFVIMLSYLAYFFYLFSITRSF